LTFGNFLMKIRLSGILPKRFRHISDFIMTQIGQSGLFRNPDLYAQTFMLGSFVPSSPFLKCPVPL